MKPSFGLVVTTLGRLDALRALLASLDACFHVESVFVFMFAFMIRFIDSIH